MAKRSLPIEADTPQKKPHLENKEDFKGDFTKIDVSLRILVALATADRINNELQSRAEQSSAKISTSDVSNGSIERIVLFEGTSEVVADAVVGTLRDRKSKDTVALDPIDRSLRIVTPAILSAYITGKLGGRLRSIQESSGAELSLATTLLPLSTERVLTIKGDNDSVRKAVNSVALIFAEHADRLAVNPVIVFKPALISGKYGHPKSIRENPTIMSADAPYGIWPPVPGAMEAAAANAKYAVALKSQPIVREEWKPNADSQTTSLQMLIPDRMVSGIIGRQGAKINEIRQASACQIRIASTPQGDPAERLITITGTNDGIKLAQEMIYKRLESEKR